MGFELREVGAMFVLGFADLVRSVRRLIWFRAAAAPAILAGKTESMIRELWDGRA